MKNFFRRLRKRLNYFADKPQIFHSQVIFEISRILAILVFSKKYRTLYLTLNYPYNVIKTRRFRAKHSSDVIKADYVCSLGGACSPAMYLQTFGLRKAATPIDWMMSYSLSDVVSMFRDNFVNFFKDISEDSTKDVGNGCRWIVDTHNGMVSIHAFKKDREVAEQYDNFIQTMQRRFVRMKEQILNAKSILFVSNRQDDISVFREFLIQMREFSNANLTLLNIRHNAELNEAIKSRVVQVGNGLKIIEYEFDDTYPQNVANRGGYEQLFRGRAEWIGNYKKWSIICSTIILDAKNSGDSLMFDDEKMG